jgi:AraC-like DNA-binding protein
MKSPLHRAARLQTPCRGVERFAFESERCFPRHAHDQYGVGVILFGGHKSWSGRGEVEAVAGDIIAVNPGEMHDGAPLGGPRRWRMIYFNPDVLFRAASEDMLGDAEFCAPQFSDALAASRVQQMFAADDSFSFEAALVAAVVPLLARRQKFSQASPDVGRAIERMEDDPAERLSLSALAAEAGLSRFQFLRAFAKATGATPQAYARQARARLARRLILAGADLAEAAVACGFSDQAHMTRACVSQFAITPGRLR